MVAESVTDEVLRFVALKTIASKSELTEKDAVELGRSSRQVREIEEKGLAVNVARRGCK